MQLTIHNPNNLPTIDYRTVKPLQGKLKTLTPDNYAKLKRVLEKRGFTVPLFVWRQQTGEIVNAMDITDPNNGLPVYKDWLLDGHGRQKVMLAENAQPYEVPYLLIEAPDMKSAKAQLLEITSQYNTITKQGFEEFTGDLDTADFEDTVFDALSFGTAKEEPEVEEDEAPTKTQESVSQLNEIYQLGTHRLMCGDATEYGAVTDLMDGELANMVFTDPPYNVDYEGKTADALKIDNDHMSDEQFTTFLQHSFDNMQVVTKEGGSIYVCHADSQGLNFRLALRSYFEVKQCIIWVKQSMVMGRQDYQWQHEPILYGWKPGASHYFTSDRTQTTVWTIDRPSRSNEHPTMKPIALCGKAINNSSQEGEIVLDLFGGSGSTLIACEQLKRRCYMMEIDPRYCDVIRKRYHKLVTGDITGWQEGTPAINAAETKIMVSDGN